MKAQGTQNDWMDSLTWPWHIVHSTSLKLQVNSVLHGSLTPSNLPPYVLCVPCRTHQRVKIFTPCIYLFLCTDAFSTLLVISCPLVIPLVVFCATNGPCLHSVSGERYWITSHIENGPTISPTILANCLSQNLNPSCHLQTPRETSNTPIRERWKYYHAPNKEIKQLNNETTNEYSSGMVLDFILRSQVSLGRLTCS